MILIMDSTLKTILPKLKSIRRHIHAHPELAFEETQTAAYLESQLKNWGFEVETGIGKTGLTVTIDSGRPGKTVALRADMDALPIVEETALAYASKTQGIMHACGHDGHCATLIGAAKVLADTQETFDGKIKFIFQPAEEGLAGAQRMIEDGVLEGVDAIFGYHNMPGIALGQAGTRVGCLLASMSSLSIQIKGKGGHAAYPHKTIDPIVIASQVIQALQTIDSRFTAPTDPVVVSITHVDTGARTFNVIPNSVTLSGTIRTTNLETKTAVIRHIKPMVDGLCKAHGATTQLHISEGYPATINTAQETQCVFDVIEASLGKPNLLKLENPHLAAEDFSFYLEHIPGCFFFVGNGTNSPALHSSTYDFNDEVIPIACELMCKAALRYLQKH